MRDALEEEVAHVDIPGLDTTTAPSDASPLWIFALFIALETPAATAAVLAGGAKGMIFTIFAVGFPCVVLPVFVWLLVKHWAQLIGRDPKVIAEALDAHRHSFEGAVVESVLAAVRAAEQPGAASEETVREQIAETYEQAFERSCVTIDRSLVLPGEHAVQVPVTSETTVGQLLDQIWFTIADAVQPYTYNRAWVLAPETPKGKPLHEIGTRWARRHGLERDDRLIEEVGIRAGSTWTVVPRDRLPAAAWPEPEVRGPVRELLTRAPKPSNESRAPLRELVNHIERTAREEGLGVERVRGEHRPRLVIADADGRYFGIYAMAGDDPELWWVGRAVKACRELAKEQGRTILPTLALGVEPTDAVRAEAKRRSVRVMWIDDSGFHEAPWAARVVLAAR